MTAPTFRTEHYFNGKLCFVSKQESHYLWDCPTHDKQPYGYQYYCDIADAADYFLVTGESQDG